MIESKLTRKIYSAIAGFALLSALSCRKTETPPAPETGNTRIGVLVDLSGPTSAVGQSVKAAVEFARDEINQAGGINGRQLEIVLADDKGAPEQAAGAVTNLTTQNNVHVLLGECSRGICLAAASKAQVTQIPMIALSSSDAKVTQQGNYIFNIAQLDSVQGKQMGAYAANNLKAKTAAVVYEEGSDYGAGLAQAFADEFGKFGGQVASRQTYNAASQNFNELLTAVRGVNPDVIYIPARSNSTVMLAKEAKQIGLKSVLLGADGWNNPALLSAAGSAFDGAYITSQYSADDPSQEGRAFSSAYQRRFGKSPDQAAALAYDAVKLIADALKRAGSSDRNKLRDALAQTAKFAGRSGTITIDADRNAARPAIIFKLQDGKVYPVYKEEP
jgi:branched-chain amino acid transport system substrate-binding protein